jgi:hypothetical protein
MRPKRLTMTVTVMNELSVNHMDDIGRHRYLPTYPLSFIVSEIHLLEAAGSHQNRSYEIRYGGAITSPEYLKRTMFFHE